MVSFIVQVQLKFLKGLPEYRKYLQRQYLEPSTHYTYEDLNLGLSYAYASHWKNSKVQGIPRPENDPKAFSAAYLSASYFMSSPLVPTYWISPELLSALSNTTVPLESFQELPIVHRKMALILPKHSLMTPFGTSVKALYWEHREPHPCFRLRIRGKDVDLSHGSDILRENHQLTRWQSLHIAALADNFATYFELFPLNPAHIQRLGIEHGSLKAQFETKLRSLLFQILCLMTARPQLFAPNKIENRLLGQPSQGKLKRFYQKYRLIVPNWIGQNYRILSQTISPGSPRGSHAAPKAHLRRGHWRQQIHGKGGTLRKLIWIEPTVVNCVMNQSENNP